MFAFLSFRWDYDKEQRVQFKQQLERELVKLEEDNRKIQQVREGVCIRSAYIVL